MDEFRKNTGQTTSEEGDKERTAKKVITLQRAMTKNGRQFFLSKNRMTPSVAAPGGTNPSDATGCNPVIIGKLKIVRSLSSYSTQTGIYNYT